MDKRFSSEKINRIVIKIGSALITKDGKISKMNIKKYSKLINQLIQSNHQVILVSSGAVASADMPKLKSNKSLLLPEKQALSSIGQINLMEIYKKYFNPKKQKIAQILISEFALKDRQSYLNARNTIFTLLNNSVLPIINENDPIATEELAFGGNDILGALICGLIDADLYLMLSNTDGYYENFGKKEQRLLSTITTINKKIEKNAQGPNDLGTGGMRAKIDSAKICKNFGIPMLILNGRSKTIIKDIFNKNKGTLFLPKEKDINNRKKWIASGLHLSGKIYIDFGAEKAIIKNKKSLLPGGISKITGNFHPGDICHIYNQKNREIAKGITNYSSYDLKKIAGKHSSEFSKILGNKLYNDAINRNNLVIL